MKKLRELIRPNIHKFYSTFYNYLCDLALLNHIKRRHPESNRETQKGTALKAVGVPLSHVGIKRTELSSF